MTLSMRRIVLGLKLRKDEKGWKEFDANGCVIALHNGTSEVGRRPPKIGFQGHRRRPPGADRTRREDVEAHDRQRAGALRGQGPRWQPFLDLRPRLGWRATSVRQNRRCAAGARTQARAL